MIYAYIVSSAALVLMLNNFFEIFGHSYSWWLCPLLFLGFVLGFIILHLAVFAIWISAINVKKPAGNRKGFRFIVKHTIPLLLQLARVKVNAEGIEKVPSNGRILFVSNHQFDYDPIIMLSVFPDHEIGFIGKKEIYTTMPFIAKAMHGIHCLPIDRENNREAAKTIIEASKLLKNDVASVGVFPEGYCSKDCEILPIRNGSLKIAYRAEVPIVVCVLNNTREIPKRMFRRKTEIDFKVVKVILYEEFKDKTTVELGNEIYNDFKTELENIRK